MTVAIYQRFKNKKTEPIESPALEDIKSENDKLFTCFSCGEVLPAKTDLCSVCGSPRPVCVVCFSELHRSEALVKLPCCSNYAHEEHILNYLEIKGYCPKCQQKISKEDLEEISF